MISSRRLRSKGTQMSEGKKTKSLVSDRTRMSWAPFVRLASSIAVVRPAKLAPTTMMRFLMDVVPSRMTCTWRTILVGLGGAGFSAGANTDRHRSVTSRYENRTFVAPVVHAAVGTTVALEGLVHPRARSCGRLPWSLGRRVGWVALVALVTLCSRVTLARGEDGPSERLGRAFYIQFCGACHGKEGKGDGPTGTVLRVPPPDLTRIAARRGGRFPEEELRAFIDGRQALAAHGSRDMPVWGEVLRGGAEDAEGAARSRIALIVAYLRTIQHERDEAKR